MTIEIKSTLREVPIRAGIYGPEGVGKSTFCAGAPGAVFIATEDGLHNIDTRAVESPKSWPELLAAVEELTNESSCGTIVIDSLDWAEKMLFAWLVATRPDEKGRKVKDIEGYGYGKGYTAALGEWRVLLAALQRAGDAGKHVLCVAHSQRKSVKNPTGEDYEQWQLNLQDGKNVSASGLIRQWLHVLGFADLDIATVEDDSGRMKGIFTGKRTLRTQPAAGYQAKTRLSLPSPMPLDWQAFEAAIKAGRPPTIAEQELTLMSWLVAAQDKALDERCQKFLDARGRTAAAYNDAIANVQRVIEEKKEQATA